MKHLEKSKVDMYENTSGKSNDPPHLNGFISAQKQF
jgi:hypothetical protein